MIELIIDVFISIGKAHVYTAGIIGASYITEKITGLNLFFDHYTWAKSPRNAEIHLDGDSGYYFIFCTLVFAYDIYQGKIELNIISISVWLIIMILLIKLFRKYYNRYQGVDPNKSDDDFA